MIGLSSGKVVGYSTRTKRCALCEAAKRNGKEPRSHDCRMNWTASSKSMEPDVAVELVKGAISAGAQVSVMVGDEDSATIKKVRESVTHEVDKWSDITHAKRSFGSHLYSLQPQHEGILSTKVINHFLKCFGYALSQNKDNVDGLEKNLKAIVPHAFGKHNKCDSSWCGFLKSPTTYKHKSLPRGKD